MFTKSAKSFVMLAALAAAGCASVLPGDPVMEDARLSVNAARNNPQVASYASLELAQAVDALRQADDAAARGGRVEAVHQLAELASQRAAIAQQVARTRADEAALLAQRRATDAQLTADVARRQAESAQVQAATAQRQAEEAQRVASSMRADAYSSTINEYRRRENERLYEARVTYVRAVVGPPQQRCWVEPTLVDRSSPGGVNVPGAIAGGVVGGIIGHQIGGGRGQDIATGIGVVGGAAAGANIGRGSDELVYNQNVQHCEYMPASARPDYWDVTYVFNGYEHRTQITTPPGSTILVNAQGEPRV
jgi:uncharacterized protein YcfJ